MVYCALLLILCRQEGIFCLIGKGDMFGRFFLGKLDTVIDGAGYAFSFLFI